jgi:NAD(P) transhydrogenase subunit alpha
MTGQTLISFFWPAQNEANCWSRRRRRRDRGRDGHGAAHQPRAEDGRAVVDGQHRGLSRGDRGRGNFGRFFTGQVTAAGKVPPAKVLVVGAGVAGLAAIGTATSLGCHLLCLRRAPRSGRTDRIDGGEFVYLDFDEKAQDGAATGGYAAPSSPEFREAQLKKFRELAPEMDIVITTALIPGRPRRSCGPRTWSRMMKPARSSSTLRPNAAATAT